VKGTDLLVPSHPDIHVQPAAAVVVLDCAPGSGAILPNNIWMVLSFSNPDAGWSLGEVAELGSTDDLFALDDGTGWALYWFGGYPYAGFEANIWCETEGSLNVSVVADDFRCLGSMPITSVHWWGSHYGWEQAGGIPPALPIGWKIGFWSNVPADPDVEPGYSYPEVLLWQIDIDANRIEIEEVGKDSYHSEETGLPEDICYQYHIALEPNEWFWQSDFEPNTIDNVFWISIAAIYDTNIVYPDYPWGWTKHEHMFNDDAAAWEMDPTGGPWQWVPLYDQTGETEDMSFMVFTECFPNYHEDYTEWLTVGRPRCWCCPRQCHGDADCEQQKIGKYSYWVSNNDLLVLSEGYGEFYSGDPRLDGPDPNLEPDTWICADFDHKQQKIGKYYYRVLNDDLLILAAYYVPAAVEPNCLDCP